MDYCTRTESVYRYPTRTRSKTDPLHQPQKRPAPLPRAETIENSPPVEKPWKHMAQTYAWVVEQEHVKLEKKNKKTEKWVIEQQNLFTDRSNQRQERDRSPRRRTWEELMSGYEANGEKQRGQEAATRRVVIEKEKEKAKAIEKEIRRIQARVQKKKEAERMRLAEEKLRA